MGDAQSVPVIGEAVTVIESGTKVVAGGACFIAGGAVMMVDHAVSASLKKIADIDIKVSLSNSALEAGCQLIEGAGQSWVEYSEKNVIVGNINAAIKKDEGDYEGAKRIRNKVKGSLEGFVDSVPVVGHVKGVVHYIDGDIEHGNKCMLGATRGAAVYGAGFATGGLTAAAGGAGVALGGVAGMAAGTGYDLTATVVDSVVHGEDRMHGFVATLDAVITKDDANKVVDLGLALTGDFVAGASAAEAGQNVAKAMKIKKQQQNVTKAIEKAQKNAPNNAKVDASTAANDTIETARNLKKKKVPTATLR